MRARWGTAVGLLCVSLAVAQSTTRPGEASDAELAKRAKAGDGDAAFALAERLADKDPKAAQQMYALAAKAGHIDALKLMLAKNRKPDGTPINKQQEVSILRRLVTAGSAEHHAQLRDASPETYWSAATQTLAKTDVLDRALMNRPQKFDVRLHKEKDVVEGERDTAAAKVTKTVRLLFKGVKAADVKDGRSAQVAGYADADGKFHVMACRVPEPQYRYEARLVPRGVAAGRDQTYDVVVTVRNTGVQPIEKVTVKVRCYQQSSPNNETRNVEFTNLLPGKGDDRTVSFQMYNFEYVGRTSIPKVEAAAGKIQW